MHKVNRNYFKQIDSENKAYILGFFYADGYNSGTQASFVQLDQDKDILEQINNELDSDITISKRIQKSNNKIKDTLVISSKEMCEDLSRLGAITNKSLNLKFPDKIIPEKFMRDFIRGYFDGDGCVWNGKRKKMKVKDASKPTGYRERIVHNVKFTITGYDKFINSLQDYLVSILNFKKTKLNYSKAKNSNNNTKECVCTMEYSGRKQMKKFFDYLYTDAKIYGKRKYNKFLETLCALEEKSSKDISLSAEISEMKISSQSLSIKEGSSTIPEMEVESSDSKYETPNS